MDANEDSNGDSSFDNEALKQPAMEVNKDGSFDYETLKKKLLIAKQEAYEKRLNEDKVKKVSKTSSKRKKTSKEGKGNGRKKKCERDIKTK